MRRALVRSIAVSVVIGVASCGPAPGPPIPSIVVPPQPSQAAPIATVLPAAPKPAAPVVFDAPEAPAVRPADLKLKVSGGGLLLGVNPTDVWLTFEGFSVVVNRATGCATESYPDSKETFAGLEKARDVTSLEAELAKPEVVQAIRDIVGMGRRFGVRERRFVLNDLVWSPDGHHVYVPLHGLLYHSADGGKTFARVDDHPASRLEMTPDGKHLVYERCVDPYCNGERKYVSIPTNGSRGPLPLTGGQTFLLRMTADSQALFWRSEAQVCLDAFDPARAVRTSSRCVAYPAKATGSWPMREWVSVSPSGNYGIVKWEEGRPGLTYVVSLVDMKTGKLLKTVTDVLGQVDDDGNMVLQAMSEGRGDHTYFYPLRGPRKLLGDHSLLAWEDHVAMLSVWRVAPLGARKCDLISFVKTP